MIKCSEILRIDKVIKKSNKQFAFIDGGSLYITDSYFTFWDEDYKAVPDGNIDYNALVEYANANPKGELEHEDIMGVRDFEKTSAPPNMYRVLGEKSVEPVGVPLFRYDVKYLTLADKLVGTAPTYKQYVQAITAGWSSKHVFIMNIKPRD